MKQFIAQAGQRRDSAPEASDFVCNLVLAAGVGEQMPRPAGASYVNFSASGDFYAKFMTSNTSITVPGDLTDGTSSVLNPGARKIPDNCTHIAVISAAANAVSMEFWS